MFDLAADGDFSGKSFFRQEIVNAFWSEFGGFPMPVAFFQIGKFLGAGFVLESCDGKVLALHECLVVEPLLEFFERGALMDFGPAAGGVLQVLHHAVHLGAARFVPNDVNVMSDKPKRQRRRAVIGRRSKWFAIVHPEGARLVPTLKYLFQGLLKQSNGDLADAGIGGKRALLAKPQFFHQRSSGNTPVYRPASENALWHPPPRYCGGQANDQ